MAKSKSKSKPRCFPSILRVLLCAGNETSPPVHPSDHITEIDESENSHSIKETLVVNDGVSTPGVVARLMGLDSLPNSKLAVKCGSGTPDSVPRSRSVNFVDYLLEFDANNANHRRVKTSASFREVPNLVQKGDELFVICMDGNGNSNMSEENQEVRHELKLEKGLGELRQRKRQGSKNKEIVSVVKKEWNQGKKNKKISKLKNEPRRVPPSKNSSKGRNHHGEASDLSSVSSNSTKCSSCSNGHSGASSRSRINTSLPNKHKKGFVEAKVKKNMRNQQSLLKVESECSLENLSPVSVLDSNDYPFLYGPDYLDGTSTLSSKSKWESPSQLSLSDEVEDSASTSKGYAFIDANKGYAFIDANKETEYYLELMLKLRTLTEQDIRESDCTSKYLRESESFENICLTFEHKIFDHLLYEVVNEVIELHC